MKAKEAKKELCAKTIKNLMLLIEMEELKRMRLEEMINRGNTELDDREFSLRISNDSDLFD